MATAQTSLDVIGLISGGKDSFFSLLHCIANGHRVVALANLYSRANLSQSKGLEDLNSFMFQTAGQGIVPLYSGALGLPLYREEIQGTALNQSKDYHAASKHSTQGSPGNLSFSDYGDETESLIPLLQNVTHAHPTATAICSGAILSTYQRTRIESVARRLGLIPLSYLWQYPSLPPSSPGGLLDDMAIAGFDVRIVKVASGGLDEELLWGNLMDTGVRRKLLKGVGRFGGSVLGEGGEYETLVVDGPTPFWRGRVEPNLSEMWIGKGGGGEAWVGLTEKSGRVVYKNDESSLNDVDWKERLRMPELWDLHFDKLVKKMELVSIQQRPERNAHGSTVSQKAWEPLTIVAKNSGTLKVGNITATQAGTTAKEQMFAINLKLLDTIQECGFQDAESIVFTTILLRTMTDFASVNEIYGQLFARPNPPARVTVACGDSLPSGVNVMVSFILCLDKASRSGLHVQSRSYWAPANIGPYSQAISIPLQPDHLDPRLVYIAGQIPLVPATMDVLPAEKDADHDASKTSLTLFQKQTCLSLQHLWRVGKTMGVNCWTNAVAFLTGVNVREKAFLAWKVWEQVHQVRLWEADNENFNGDGPVCFDVWDAKYGGSATFAKDEENSHRLPDFERMPNQAACFVPPFFAVQVDELPRGCNIEWQSEGLAYSDPSTPTVESRCSHIAFPSDKTSSDHEFCIELKEILENQKQLGGFHATVYTPRPDLIDERDVEIVPCKTVWGQAGVKLKAGIAIRRAVDRKMVGQTCISSPD